MITLRRSREMMALVTLASVGALSARTYSQLTAPCKNAVAISGNLPCTSVADCEAQCDAQAAAAPGTGATPCVAVDTNGKNACYMKSHCDGTPGTCAGQCGYRAQIAPTAPPTPTPPIPPAPAGMTLREAADRHGVFIGAATNVDGLTSKTDLMYKAVEQTHFSLTTAENACKVGPIHPAPGPDGYSWAGCDTIFAEAEKANQTVRGHNLCWHNENPGWLNTTLTSAELVAALESHIAAVIGHYGRRAYAWDVVNEAITDGAPKGGSIFKTAVPWYPKGECPRFLSVARRARGAFSFVLASPPTSHLFCSSSPSVRIVLTPPPPPAPPTRSFSRSTSPQLRRPRLPRGGQGASGGRRAGREALLQRLQRALYLREEHEHVRHGPRHAQPLDPDRRRRAAVPHLDRDGPHHHGREHRALRCARPRGALD